MIDLTPEDVAVIFRLAGNQALEDLPVPELNDEGQLEVVNWIESVGKMDDDLSPYAWFSLAEEAALAPDMDEPVYVEMLPTYTLSGDLETLELCRRTHFNWSMDVLPLEVIQNPIVQLNMGVPLRFLMMAEVAGVAFAKRVCDVYPAAKAMGVMLTAGAINAFFIKLCEGAEVVLNESLLLTGEEQVQQPAVVDAQLEAAIAEGLDAAQHAIEALDPESHYELPTVPQLFGQA